MAFACTVLPIPKEAREAKRAKRTASHFQPSPFCRAYMGPPSILPRRVLTRYFTASSPSAYLVEMPNTPVSQHHNTAPGPPRAMAVATPMMLPVPMVAARAVARAPNCDTSPAASLSRLTESLIALKILRCGKRRRMVRNRWVPNRRMIMGHPQRTELKAVKKSLSAVIVVSFLYYCSNLILTWENPMAFSMSPNCFRAFCSALAMLLFDRQRFFIRA